MQVKTEHTTSGESASKRNSITPGSSVGLLGGGQLGRMFGIAARKMGYRLHTFEPQADCPAGQISDVEVNAEYTDEAALQRFAAGVDVVSFEFENVPLAATEIVSRECPVRPRGEVLHICQNREREKLFLRGHGFPHAPFEVIESAEDLEKALEKIGRPAVLKTADFGYDGKGQFKIDGDEPAAAIWAKFGAPRAVLEQWMKFEAELSVICARGLDGAIQVFPPSENVHSHHILDLSIVPARFPDEVLAHATELATRIARELDVVGLIAVEFFLAKDGHLIVNELAPRPHNSGHFTFDACVTSQFEQQLRAICGLPLGSPELLTPVVMWNILGDLWKDGEPDWSVILSEPRAKLHLYGKEEARPGRKMGHVCVLAGVPEALKIIEDFKTKLGAA